MGSRFDQYAKLERASFRKRFDTPEKVREFVEYLGRRADELLPELHQRQQVQRSNVETLRVVGGEPFQRAQEGLWDTSAQIEFYEPWQQVRDCLAAGLLRVEITSRFVHFTDYRRRRICHFGPGNSRLEFNMGGERQLESLTRTAKAKRKG